MAKSKKKSSTGLVFLAFLLVIVAIAGGGYFFFNTTIRARYEKQIDDLQSKVENNTHVMYVALNDIKAGQKVASSDVTQIEMLAENTQGFFSKDDIGKYAVTDINSGDLLYSRDFTQVDISDSSLRSVEYSCFYIPTGMKANQKCDIRIRFKNGEDYIVLSGKIANKVDPTTNTIFFDMSEREQQYVSSAIIDSKQYAAIMYAVVYEQPNVQENSAITYVPYATILDSLRTLGLTADLDIPSLKDLRSALEQRLYDYYKQNNHIINTDISTDTSNVTYNQDSAYMNTNGDGASIGNSSYLDTPSDTNAQ